MGQSPALRILAAIAITAGVTALFVSMPGVNGTTVGFGFLLAVLGIASGWGFPAAVAASLAAAAQYNFFFLPPVASFTIGDSRNWVALASFLATAAIASRLSAQAQRRAAEAELRKRDLARLYELGRAILLAGPEGETEALERAMVSIFGLRDARIRTSAAAPPGKFNLHARLRVGQHEIGALYLDGPPLAAETAEAIASMVAIAVERSRLQTETARLLALRESDALKSALLDGCTHDLRTPLTSIKAAATALVAGTARNAATQQELAVVIDEEADHLDALLANMLEMARIQAGAIRPQRRPESVEMVMHAALDRLPDSARVHCDIPAQMPEVLVDGPMASRVLRQLLENALTYSPPGSEVIVTAKRDEARVRIEVRDHGPGVPAALQERIFEKFTRSPQARVQRPQGQGMGLAIARGLAQAQGGGVGYQAGSDGGACFWLTLPLAEAVEAIPVP